MEPEILKILQNRLAQGEITEEEYKQLLSTLMAPAGGSDVQAAPPPMRARLPEQRTGGVRVQVDPGCRYLSPSFYMTCFLGFNVMAVAAFGATFYFVETYSSNAMFVSIGVGVVSALLGWLPLYFMLYRCWAAIQHVQVRTTPGKAVGFCFIPLFNLYWNFVAMNGFVQDFNAVVQFEGRSNLKIPPAIGLFPPILLCVNVVPYIGCLSAALYLIFLPIYIMYVASRVDRYVCEGQMARR